MIFTRPLSGLCQLLLLLAIALVPGCRCSGSRTLAQLIEKNGFVERDYAAKVGLWEQAPMGAHFMLGDGVRAGKSAGAMLELSEGSQVSLRPDTEIRFIQSQVNPSAQGSGTTAATEKAVGIAVEAGEISVVAGEDRLQLATHIGMAVIDPGSQVEIKKSETDIEFRVNIGRAVIRSLSEDPSVAVDEVITAGESVRIDIGTAVLTRMDASDKVADLSATSALSQDTGSSDTGSEIPRADTASGTTMEEPSEAPQVPVVPMPTTADFRAVVGESFYVHVARPPSVVELVMGDKCSNGAVLRAGKNEWRFEGENPRLSLRRGRTSYAVTCLDDSGQPIRDSIIKARAIVLKDAGKARLPRSAPPSYVDADGRLYKILYQNRLPQVTITWPGAPQAAEYLLEVVYKSGVKKSFKSDKPEYRFRTGTLKEGTHRLKFKARGGSARASKTTTVQLMFDNVTPKASIKSPTELGFTVGDAVVVKGIAAPGWQVASSDGELNVDKHNRFEGELKFAGKYRSLSFRLFHQLRGVHYYLRRGKMR